MTGIQAAQNQIDAVREEVVVLNTKVDKLVGLNKNILDKIATLSTAGGATEAELQALFDSASSALQGVQTAEAKLDTAAQTDQTVLNPAPDAGANPTPSTDPNAAAPAVAGS